MKITGQCPVCGGQEIYMVLVNAGGGQGINLLPHIGGLGVLFGFGNKYEQYICGHCGYAQFFVPAELLPEISEIYDQVYP